MTRRQLHNFMRLLVASIIAALAVHLLGKLGIPMHSPSIHP